MKLYLPLVLSVCVAAAQEPGLRTFAGGVEAGDGGLAREASLRFVQGIAIAAHNGDIAIADADDHRVRVIRPGTLRITTLAGTGYPGFSGDGGFGNQARLNTPYGLSFAPNGDLYIADLGNARVRVLTVQGTIRTVAGGGVGPRLVAPRNVLAAPDGRLYISDFGSNQILVLEPGGNHRTLPEPTPNFRSPAGLALDPAGHLYIADSGNGRVLRYSSAAGYSVHASGLELPTGVAWHSSGALLITDARGDFLVRQPLQGEASQIPLGGRDVAVDALGNIYTAGASWVRKLSPAGFLEVLADPRFQTFRGENVPASAARLFRPSGVAVDRARNVYFTDTQNHRVRVVRPNGLVETLAGNGEAGFRGDGGPARDAQVNRPTGIITDAFDNVYFTDAGNHRVRVISPSGVIRTAAGNGRPEFSLDGLLPAQAGLFHPAGLALDAEGRIYIAEAGGHRIRRFLPGGRMETVAGSGIRGSSATASDPLLAMLNAPAGIAVDSQNNLYIADRGNNAIRKVELGTGRWSTLATGLQAPEGVVAASDGSLYFTESQRHTLSRLLPDGKREVVAGRPNENGLNGEAGNASALTLNEPLGLAWFGERHLIFADSLNDRLRILEFPPPPAVGENQSGPRLVHGATFSASALVPGMLMTLFTPPTSQQEYSDLLFDGFPATVQFRSPTQLNFQVPSAIAGRSAVAMEWRHGGQLRHREVVSVAAAAPAFFPLGANGQIAAVFPDGQLNSDARPARPGDVLVLYGTGEGLRTVLNGLEVPFLPIRVTIGGLASEILYAGAAPGFPGLLQVNLRVPATAARGAVPVQIEAGPVRGPAGQTIFIF